MTRFTLGDVLPLSGSIAPLLTASIEMPHPATLTELAKRGGISKFAASRAAAVLMEHELLQLDDFGYEFNDEHMLAPTARALAWRFSGVRRPPKDDGWPLPVFVDRHDDFSYRRLIPASLRVTGSPGKDAPNAGGPDLVTARDLCTWIEGICPELWGYARDGQDVFTRWSNERLRDMIHQTLHFAQPLRACLDTLVEASDVAVQAGADPRTVRVNDQAWARATYLVSAEASNVLHVVSILDTAIRIGGRVNTTRDQALSSLSSANYVGQGSDLTERYLQDALSSECEAEALWADSSSGPYRNLGGFPRACDVGTAGDQILAVRLLRTAHTLTSQVATMANYASLTTWRSAHPEEAAQIPLCTTVPVDLLD